MSFGFSIGDFVAVIQLANKIRKDFAGAPKQYQAIASEVKTFSVILQDIEIYVSAQEISSTQQKTLHDAVASSSQILKDIETTLAKFSRLTSVPASGLKEHARRIWDRVKWEPEEMRDLRTRITFNTVLLSALADGFDRNTIINVLAVGTSKLLDKEQSRDNQEILNWLAPSDYAAQHATHAYQRLTGTGQWLLDSEAFKHWVDLGRNQQANPRVVGIHSTAPDLKGNVILLQGIPGAGKSVLSSLCIEYLQQTYSSNVNIGICYFYCDYSRQKEHTVEFVLSTLIRQLAQSTAASGLPSDIIDLFNRYKTNISRPTYSELVTTLTKLAGLFQNAYIVIDALDEALNSDHTRRRIISELLKLGRTNKVRLLFTSRPVLEITNLFNDYKILEIRASKNDLISYVRSSIPDLPNFVGKSVTLQEEIVEAITNAADGIFLLATLQVQALEGARSPKAIRKALESFTQQASSYGQAYSSTMERICSQIRDHKEVAIDALMWTVFGEQQMTSEELLHALATSIEESSFDEDDIPDIDDVLSACCGLLIMEGETKILRLVHRTTLEYLRESHSKWFRNPQKKMSQVCLVYKSHIDVLVQTNARCGDTNGNLDQYVFYNYASAHGLHHASLVKSETTIEEAIAVQEHLGVSSSQRGESVGAEYLSLYVQKSELTGLHLLAHFGANKLIPAFVGKYDINGKNKNGRTPISYAIEQGNSDTVALLLQYGAQWITPESRHNIWYLERPYWRAGLGREYLPRSCPEIIEIFINDHNNIDSIDLVGRNALSYAAEFMDVQAVSLLLQSGADPFFVDYQGRTPLSYAADASGGSSRVGTLLRSCFDLLEISVMQGNALESSLKARVHRQDENGITPLIYAVSKDQGSVLRLLNHGADPNDCDDKKSPFWLMNFRYDMGLLEEILLKAIESGLDVNTVDHMGRSILHHTVVEYHTRKSFPQIHKAFMHAGGDCLIRDNRGMGLLEYACLSTEEQNLFEVAKFPNIACHGTTSWSAMHWACVRGTFQMLLALANLGFKASIVQTQEPPVQWTPLDVAVYRGNSKLVNDYGNLKEGLPWSELIHSGIVMSDPTTGSITAVRTGKLGPAVSRTHRYQACSACFLGLRGYEFECIETECQTPPCFKLCILCYRDVALLHPHHTFTMLPEHSDSEKLSQEVDSDECSEYSDSEAASEDRLY